MDPRPLPDDADADDDGLTRAPEASPAFLRGLSVVFACIFGFGLVYCARDFLRFPAEPVAGALDALAARVDERPCWVALELPRDADVRTVRDGTVDEVVLTPRGGGKVLAIRCSSSFRPADIARGRATGGLERATPYLRGRLRDAGAPVDEAREVYILTTWVGPANSRIGMIVCGLLLVASLAIPPVARWEARREAEREKAAGAGGVASGG